MIATAPNRDLDQVWRPPPEALALGPGEVHVWRALLDQLPDFADLLSVDETERAAGFHFEKDRRRYTAARGLLRTLLARYLGALPERLKFAYGARGKPALDDLGDQPTVDAKPAAVFTADIRFSLSHSNQLAVIAFARNRELGIDLECMASQTAGPEIAERFFSAAEIAALRSVPEAQRRAAFFAGWTRKEAYIKAIGSGLFTALDRFTVSLAPGEPAALLAVHDDPRAASRWTLRELYPGAGYAGAIAVEGRDWQLRCYDWSARHAGCVGSRSRQS